uniref:Uncharacterized protein n=1 Tax=Triticum urartu TaxID=4572 RepID=A0A8R7K1T0_TRIUA
MQEQHKSSHHSITTSYSMHIDCSERNSSKPTAWI